MKVDIAKDSIVLYTHDLVFGTYSITEYCSGHFTNELSFNSKKGHYEYKKRS